MEKNRAHIDGNGNIDVTTTPEGEKAWLKTYDQMKSNGATEEEARKTADEVKEKMDKICSNAIILDNDE